MLFGQEEDLDNEDLLDDDLEGVLDSLFEKENERPENRDVGTPDNY
jgi:hypothetical protein